MMLLYALFASVQKIIVILMDIEEAIELQVDVTEEEKKHIEQIELLKGWSSGRGGVNVRKITIIFDIVDAFNVSHSCFFYIYIYIKGGWKTFKHKMNPHSPDFAMRHAGYEKCATVDVLEQTNGPNIYVTIWDTRNVLKNMGVVGQCVPECSNLI